MLTAYRVGVTELWSALVATARGLPDVPADDIIDLAGTVFAVQNTDSDAALAAYRDEARETLRTRERERAAMVEVILAGVAARGMLWEVANALRLPVRDGQAGDLAGWRGGQAAGAVRPRISPCRRESQPSSAAAHASQAALIRRRSAMVAYPPSTS